MLIATAICLTHDRQKGQQPIVETRNEQERIAAAVKGALRRLGKGGDLSTVRVLEDIEWDATPALWISYSVDDPLMLYTHADKILDVVRTAAAAVHGDLRHLSLELRWRHVIMVPLLNGKSIDQSALVIPWHLILDWSGGKMTGWSAIKKLVSLATFDRLGIEQWRHPRMEVADRLRNAIAELRVHVGTLADLARLDADVTIGSESLDPFVSDKVKRISSASQQVADTVAEMAFIASDRGSLGRVTMLTVATIILECHERWLPESVRDGKELTTAVLLEWTKALESASVEAGVVYLYWLADIHDRNGIDSATD